MKKLFAIFISISLIISVFGFSGCKKDNSFLVGVFNSSKEDLNKFHNFRCNNQASASVQSSNYAFLLKTFNSSNKKIEELNGYKKFGIVSYITDEALNYYLFEENNDVSNLINVDSPEVLWDDDATKIESLITLDMKGNDNNIHRIIICAEFKETPLEWGAFTYRKDREKMPVILDYIMKLQSKYFHGIQNVSITKSDKDNLTFYINFIPVKEVIEFGVYATDVGYYSADKKIFLKVNTIVSKVVLEDGVEKILSEAFIYPTHFSSVNPNTTLKEVVLPNSVKIIEYAAFGGCIMLEKINRPTSLEYLDPDWQKDVGIYSLDHAKNLYGSPSETHLFDFEIVN